MNEGWDIKKGRNRREREGKREGRAGRRCGEVTVRPCLNVVASVGALPSVVEPTLSRTLCSVLVGISGAPTGPISRVSGWSSKSGPSRQGSGVSLVAVPTLRQSGLASSVRLQYVHRRRAHGFFPFSPSLPPSSSNPRSFHVASHEYIHDQSAYYVLRV